MKIVDIKIFVSNPGRNFVTVKIETDEGVFGLGDATLNGRELAVVAYLEEHIKPCLIGRDPHKIEDIWQYLYKGCYWRRGPITMTAIAGIDMALWDIKGKVAGLPVYELLGGKSREKIRVYGHANGQDIDDTLHHLDQLISEGFTAVRLQCAIPGLEGTYGTLAGKKDYFELQSDRPLPPEQLWDTKAYLDFVPELFKKAREKYGNSVDLLHDTHSRLTPIEAARLGKILEPYNLLFLEDSVTAENQSGYKYVREHTTTPLAVGEIFNSIWDAKELIENQWIDYLRTAATHSGGITPMRRMTDFASLYHVRTAPHGPPDISPIGHAAHAHLNSWTPNFGIQEFIGFGGEALNRVFKHPMTFENGHLLVNNKPGLGVEFDEEAASQFPYKRSYLPVSRLKDGTLWNW
ncbi:D-mannonate dehydratase ManD [Formosa algae]|uniref:Mannonate dehydratase n=1 Tax=Formosa algae TaxID=225843 RepID=A0A9X0YQ32_9FLAO|nr:D-mannonate dehydratase ManD [Formosa algae]MBP1840938.1 mannonate dehydratase [Formosa algae]MDQ0336165.1 mannonate dehydratase [Formosa algae]OEI79943.1 bifunctional D-altronate/D-mannonate dehydratase [Formosa algae]